MTRMEHLRRTILWLGLGVFLVVSMKPSCRAYSVLTHEQIVDLAYSLARSR